MDLWSQGYGRKDGEGTGGKFYDCGATADFEAAEAGERRGEGDEIGGELSDGHLGGRVCREELGC